MSGPQMLGRHVSMLAGKALGKHGMAFGQLLADWATVMGPRLADQTTPLKLSFPRAKREDATLYLRASGPAALLLQHEEPQVIQRINAFFGFKAVARIKLVQAPPAIRTGWRPPAPPPRLSKADEAALEANTSQVESPDLRDALLRLGRVIGPPGGRRP